MTCFLTPVVAGQGHIEHKVQNGISPKATMRATTAHGDLHFKGIQFTDLIIVIITLLDQMINDYV